MKKTKIYLLICWLILISGLAFAATSDVIIQNETIQNGQVVKYYGYNSLTAGPAFVMEAGSDVSLGSSGKVILAPGFSAEVGSKLLIQIVDVPPLVFAGDDDLIKNGGSVTLSWDAGYDNPETTLLPDIGTVTASGSMVVFPTATTLYTLRADRGTSILEETFLVTMDDHAPELAISYPENNGQINFEEAKLGLISTFTDNTGIESIKLFSVDGQTDTEITSQAIVSGNSISYDLFNLENGTHTIKIIVTDNAGNETIESISFELDKLVPVTTPSVAAGSYSEVFTVNLTCSESATIFYSTDGSPPFEGGANTTSGPSPIQGIKIDKSMNLQFFAKDPFGNIESVQSFVYLMGAIPDAVTGLNGNYTNPNVNLTWAASAGADKYRIYRTLSPVNRDILVQSGQGGYAPPSRLCYSTSDILSGTISFTDTNILPGMIYYYGVTQVDSDGVEGPTGQLAPVQIPEAGTAQDQEDAKARALAWLEFTQNVKGFWEDKKETRILTTSQVLSAYQRFKKYDLNTAIALFYLRGQLADNNDYLARKILTLYAFNQNVDVFVNKLVSQAYFDNSNLNGWGLNSHYAHDALDTALGKLAIKCHSSTTINNFAAHQLQTNTDLQSSETGKFGWIQKGDSSVYVSSLVYQVIDTSFPDLAPVFDPSWITNSQAVDGSFGAGLIDTSAVLLWTDNLTPTQIQSAESYLVFQQKANGSWEDDPYITGLCLEALLK